MTALAIIGNISRDVVRYFSQSECVVFGGAALHIARAAVRAGLLTIPVSVIGRDLESLRADPRLLRPIYCSVMSQVLKLRPARH